MATGGHRGLGDHPGRRRDGLPERQSAGKGRLAALPDLPPDWRWERRDGLAFLLARPLEALDVPHVFTTRAGGASAPPFDTLNLGRAVGDDPQAVQANRARVLEALGRSLADQVEASQVHGQQVAMVEGADRGHSVPDVDGLITRDPAVVLTMHCADCVPMLLVDPVRRAVAAVHTGWRGTAAGAAPAAVATMVGACGSRPSDLVAAIGPAIGPCCYEVDAPVVERFAPWPWRDRVVSPAPSGRWMLDLWEANRRQLVDAGVPPGSVAVAGLCTAHHPALFFSHRRDGTTGRMAAHIAVSEP